MNFEAVMTAWMEHLFIQKGRSAVGVEKYTRTVRAFFTWLATTGHNTDPLTVSRANIEAWQKALFYDQGNISNQTRATKLSACKSFFGYLVYAGLREDNPTGEIPTPKISAGLPQKFSTEELGKIFSAPRLDTVRGIRDLAILMVLYASGPRISELCNLDVNNISDTGGYIRLRFVGVKGGKDRTITLRHIASKPLREWIIARKGLNVPGPQLFCRLQGGIHSRLTDFMAQRLLKRYATLVGLDGGDVFAHKMRATFASDIYDSGDDCCPRCGHGIVQMDLLKVQLALGHTSPEATLRYIAISDRHLKKTAIPDRRMNQIFRSGE